MRWNRALNAALLLALSLACLATPALPAAAEDVPFDSDRWTLRNAEVVEHLGRPALKGFAYLKDVAFANGVIEVDVAVTGRPSYPGVVFRMQSERDHERYYLRPHRENLYPDALQYTPVITGIAGWQLYSGEGYTDDVELPADEWVHLRLEVSGTQGRIFVGNDEQPALEIHELRHGESRGWIGLMGPRNDTAWFSNFSYRETDDLVFAPFVPPAPAPGFLTAWELSPGYKMHLLDLEFPYSAQEVEEIVWTPVTADHTGLVDIARTHGRFGGEPDCVYARTTLRGETGDVFALGLGYSDLVAVFLNDRLLFMGNSAYRSRDPSFAGILGLFDELYLPLRAGDNELVLMVAEAFGGWGFRARDTNAVFLVDGAARTAETPRVFSTPEAVLHDPAHDRFYVSNFDQYGMTAMEGGQYLSTFHADGTVDRAKWVGGLRRPTGMALSGSTLYVVDRGSLVEVDTEAGRVVNRHEIPDAVFPNDVTMDDDGVLYVSDTDGGKIYRFADGVFEVWLSGDEIARPNGVLAHDGELLIGCSGDRCLRAADLATAELSVRARFEPGIIDGIRPDGAGNVLVSHWEGRVYRVTPSGQTELLLDTTASSTRAADFEYLPERSLLLVPTFNDNHVAIYRLPG